MTRTGCLLAHIRAATPGLPVTELNCQPFRSGRLTFMHNGEIAGFQSLRRPLLAGLSDAAFASIEGSTDSEHLFAIFLDRLRELGAEGDPAARLATALEMTIDRVEVLRQALASDRPALLNLVVCDGDRVVVTRYASGQEPASSLYFSRGRVYLCDQGFCRMTDDGSSVSAVIVASEPLDDGDRWTRVEPGHIVLVTPDLKVSTRPLKLGVHRA